MWIDTGNNTLKAIHNKLSLNIVYNDLQHHYNNGLLLTVNTIRHSAKTYLIQTLLNQNRKYYWLIQQSKQDYRRSRNLSFLLLRFPFLGGGPLTFLSNEVLGSKPAT